MAVVKESIKASSRYVPLMIKHPYAKHIHFINIHKQKTNSTKYLLCTHSTSLTKMVYLHSVEKARDLA